MAQKEASMTPSARVTSNFCDKGNPVPGARVVSALFVMGQGRDQIASSMRIRFVLSRITRIRTTVVVYEPCVVEEDRSDE
ncbi:uncharacterized protein N7459_002310 [Penicillium hispanicum]|uniref:uncharacterized protein n=1 Tax=Penicillium hispanicum TaxID=1080232 RepID=UPI0025416BBB|nr:uncharacterized protein N7459_002310 [Penicillium hispanicum]KAJ5591941.1 hypothetical protein N7459_002310 [Penicillium hispanicum]